MGGYGADPGRPRPAQREGPRALPLGRTDDGEPPDGWRRLTGGAGRVDAVGVGKSSRHEEPGREGT
ncbi:hypothetical protein NUM3379_04800 [Kineococcus sp. NUM-3379]